MYWTQFVNRSDLEQGRTLVHGLTRMNLASVDLETFIDPPDAAFAVAYKALEPTDSFEQSIPVWLATFRRKNTDDGTLDTLKRIFVKVADTESLVEFLIALCDRARDLGYRKLWLHEAVMPEPLLAPALNRVIAHLGTPLEWTPGIGGGFRLASPARG